MGKFTIYYLRNYVLKPRELGIFLFIIGQLYFKLNLQHMLTEIINKITSNFRKNYIPNCLITWATIPY